MRFRRHGDEKMKRKMWRMERCCKRHVEANIDQTNRRVAVLPSGAEEDKMHVSKFYVNTVEASCYFRSTSKLSTSPPLFEISSQFSRSRSHSAR